MPLLRRFLLSASLAITTAAAACADGVVWRMYDADNDEWHVIVEDEGEFVYLHLTGDGDYIDGHVIQPGNPNPDNGTTTPGDQGMREDLLKQKGGTGYLQPGLYDTFLAYFDYIGVSVNPYHNPYGDDQGGLSPSGSTGFHDPLEDMFETGGAGKLGGVGFDGNGGPACDQIKKVVRQNGTSNDDDSDSSARPQDGGLWGPDMPGPPELVNPAPLRKSSKRYELW